MKMALRGYSIGQEGVMNERRYERTMYACFIGYIVQAIVNNFVTLLFLTFEKSYHIPLGKITMLITINFGIQLLVDLLSAGFVDKIGYKVSILGGILCGRWRLDRSFDQSDHGKLSNEK